MSAALSHSLHRASARGGRVAGFYYGFSYARPLNLKMLTSCGTALTVSLISAESRDVDVATPARHVVPQRYDPLLGVGVVDLVRT